MKCIAIKKWHDFEFTDEQRCLIYAALPRRGKKFPVDRDLFLENIEDAVGHYLVDCNISDGLSPRKLRDEACKMAVNARALRMAIERLPNENRFMFDASFARLSGVRFGPKNDEDITHLSVDRDIGLLVDMLEKFEGICDRIEGGAVKTGINKKFEYSVAVQIVISYEQFIGKASASPNGALFRIVKAICDVTGINIGEDLFRRAVKEYAEPDGYCCKKT